MPLLRLAMVALTIAAAVLPTSATAQDARPRLSAIELFELADRARAEGRDEDALALYTALTRDPDLEIRTEARFRKGMLLSALGRNVDAALAFRELLDERPDATRVRLELAKVLAQLGDDGGARRALRQAQAAGLPDGVEQLVDQFAAALRSTKRLGGSIQLALAPDSNVNRATSARTLDTVIAPLTLSQDARRQSGLGLRVSGQGYARIAIADDVALLPRLSSTGSLYRDAQFNDISGSALLGVEWSSGRDRITTSVGPTWRWYGTRLYARTKTVAFNWIHPLSRRAQLSAGASVARARYQLNPLQSGGLFDGSLAVERALTPQSGIGIALGVTRQSARDPGYATWAGSAGLSGWYDIARSTLFASIAVRRIEGDARLFLFPKRRREWLTHVSAGATFRSLTIAGFAPLLRASYERNVSSVALYEYQRLAGEVGITRAF